MPPVVTINLETLGPFELGEAGGFGPFANQSILAYNVRRQAGFVPADGPLPANDPVPPNGPVPAMSVLPPRPLKACVQPRPPITILLPRSLRPSPLNPRVQPRLSIIFLPHNQQPRRPPAARRRTRPAVEAAGIAVTTRISGISRTAAIAGTAGTTQISGISRIASIRDAANGSVDRVEVHRRTPLASDVSQLLRMNSTA